MELFNIPISHNMLNFDIWIKNPGTIYTVVNLEYFIIIIILFLINIGTSIVNNIKKSKN